MADPAPTSKTENTRFVEDGEHTVIDMGKRLIWMKKDTRQLTGNWLSWVQARDYAKELCQQHFGGYNDWRLPTAEEAKSLFSKEHENKDHMGQRAYLPSIFDAGFGFLCWTSEVRNKIQAVRFGYRKGGIMYDDIYRVSRGATRFVRDINK